MMLAVILNMADNTLNKRNPTQMAMTMIMAGSMSVVRIRSWMVSSFS